MSTRVKRIAVVGGGINGVMTAWALARRGKSVELFEAAQIMSGTSSASTKLLHGGLRYLEYGHLSLVREALRERAWWLRQAPHLAREIRVILPVYATSRRPPWKLDLGLRMYDFLAGEHGLTKYRRLKKDELLQLIPDLNREGLREAYVFSDGQMDDYALGRWAAHQAEAAGVNFREETSVERVSTDGKVVVNGDASSYDLVYNVAGPQAMELLARSGIKTRYRLNLVKGSHIVLDFPMVHGLYVQVPTDLRLVFILPFKNKMLVGTTEIPSSLGKPIYCSTEEEEYLLSVVSHYLGRSIPANSVISRFAGLRPLVAKEKAGSVTASSREYALERHGSLITVLGGKWTTSRALGEKAAAMAG